MPVPALPNQPTPGTPVNADLSALMTPTSYEVIGGGTFLPIAPNEPFFLRHNPKNWQISRFLDGVFALPEVTMHVLAPGVNGVRTRDKNEPVEAAYKKAVRASQDKGWNYLDPSAPIPEDCLPPGIPTGGYIREPDCRHPLTGHTGKRYVEAWNVPQPTLPEEDQEFKFHYASHERWLQYLVESGQIAPMNPSILAPMLARVRGHLERAQTLTISSDVRAIFVARKQAIVDAYASAEPLKARRPMTLPTDVNEQAVADARREAQLEAQADHEQRLTVLAKKAADAEARAEAAERKLAAKSEPKAKK